MAANNWQDWNQQQLQQVDPTFGGSSAFGNIFNQILGNTGPNGVWDYNKTQQTLDQYGNDFTQQFQNAVGRPPTAAEINQFYSQAVSPVLASSAGFSGTDPNAIVQQYVPQAFQSQIQQQQQSQIPNLEKQISNVSSDVGSKTAAQLADPSSSAYQAFSGSMNNLGITPASGAFQSGEGAAVGNAASNTMQSLLSSLGGGAIAGNQSPTFSSLYGTGQNAGTGINTSNQDMNQFNLEASLAQSLNNGSGGGGWGQGALQGALGGGGVGAHFGPWGALAGAAGGAGLGAASGGKGGGGTSYVCFEMIKRGLITDGDMDDFHLHIMPAMFKKGRAFWKYAVDGWRLVEAVNTKGLDWKVFRPLLFDRVMEEPDPCKAVDLYADACHQLCISADRSLWDERVFRTSFLDTLIFLPRLLCYTPFLRALWKCLRIKMLFVYDKPRWRVHIWR
jgi:hypothetical protein